MHELAEDIKKNIKKISEEMDVLKRTARREANDVNRGKELSLQIKGLLIRRAILEKNLANAQARSSVAAAPDAASCPL